jgi:hypothetical protein
VARKEEDESILVGEIHAFGELQAGNDPGAAQHLEVGLENLDMDLLALRRMGAIGCVSAPAPSSGREPERTFLWLGSCEGF